MSRALTVIKIGGSHYRATIDEFKKWIDIYNDGRLLAHQNSGEIVIQRLDLPDGECKISYVAIPQEYFSAEDGESLISFIMDEITNTPTPAIFISSNVDIEMTPNGMLVTENHDK